MSVRIKILLIVVSFMLGSILLFNIVSGALFSKYIESEESAQMNAAADSLNSYINEQQAKYQGIANEWAHRDETFDFMEGNESYIDSYLTRQTFNTLDVSFMLYNYNYDWIYSIRYYDLTEGDFREADNAFLNDIVKTFPIAVEAEEMSSLFKIDGEYYFVSSAQITDSLMRQSPNGVLILGRAINFSAIEENTGSRLVEIKTRVQGSDTSKDKPIVSNVNKDESSMFFECVVPGEMGDASLVFTFEKQRDIYQSRGSEYQKFAIGVSLYLVVIALLLFLFLEILVTRRLRKIVKWIKSSDMEGSGRLGDAGNDEIAVVSSAISSLLARTPNEQNIVSLDGESIYSSILHITDCVIVVNEDGALEFVNLAAQKLTKLNQTAIGLPIEDLIKFADESIRATAKSPIQEVLDTKTASGITERTILIVKHDKKIDIEYTASPFIDEIGNLRACIIVFRDCNKKKEKQKQSEYLSYHDQLTELYNRRYLEEELKRLDTKRNLPISMIFADVNGLKIINDAFGHHIGDQLLRKVAKVIRDMCRADEIIARTGGDEFVILLTKMDKDTAEKLANRIKNKIQSYKIMGIRISLSFGWDTKTLESVSIWETLRSAEDAMHHNKILANPDTRRTMINAVFKKLHTNSPIEKAHAKRVSEICVAIGKADGMGEEELIELEAAGWLHDIGKVGVDMNILNSSDILSGTDWVQLRSHAEKGYRILSTSTGFYGIAEYVLMHHERWDGKGYPKGLAGDETPKNARIMAIAEAYDSMTRPLPSCKKVSSADLAVEELKKCSGTQFDPRLVEVFIEKVLEK